MSSSAATETKPTSTTWRQTLSESPNWTESVECNRVEGTAEAQAMRLSLPIPRGHHGHYALAGNPTQHEAVGFREDHDGGNSVRRAILLGTAPGAPEQLNVRGGDGPSGAFTGPEAELRVVEQRSDIALVYEIDELVLRMDDRWLGIRIGF